MHKRAPPSPAQIRTIAQPTQYKLATHHQQPQTRLMSKNRCYRRMPLRFHGFSLHTIISVQLSFSLIHVQLFAIPWTATRQASLSITNSQSLLKLMSIESVMPSNHLILCRPFLPPSVFPKIRVFSNESGLHIGWQKYWSLSFNISPSNEYSGLIFFRIDWLDLLTVQGTLKSLFQYQISKVSIPQCSAFFLVQLSHLHMTTGKKSP